ncbi:hypothetical protein WA158_007335 [Blastocystis sp. Blastoise]
MSDQKVTGLNDIELNTIEPEKPDVKVEISNEEPEKPQNLDNLGEVKVKRHAPEQGLTSTEFIINLMKGIAGTGALAIPYAFSQMGLLIGVIGYFFLAYANFYGADSVLKLKNMLVKTKKYEESILFTSSEYSRVVYTVLGKTGYEIIKWDIVISLWGGAIGTMVVLTDFASQLPYAQMGVTADNSTIRLCCCIILTIIGAILVLFKNTQPLVYISSFGLFAMIISFIILFIKGGMSYGLQFSMADLFPTNFEGTLTYIGVLEYSLEFIFFVFPLYSDIRPSQKSKASKSIFISVILIVLIYISPLFLIFKNDPNGLKSNVLLNLDPNSVENTIICIGMLVSVIGAYPLNYLGINEILEAKFAKPKTNKFFVIDKARVILRLAQVILVSLISFYVPFFGSIMSFNIL